MYPCPSAALPDGVGSGGNNDGEDLMPLSPEPPGHSIQEMTIVDPDPLRNKEKKKGDRLDQSGIGRKLFTVHRGHSGEQCYFALAIERRNYCARPPPVHKSQVPSPQNLRGPPL